MRIAAVSHGIAERVPAAAHLACSVNLFGRCLDVLRRTVSSKKGPEFSKRTVAYNETGEEWRAVTNSRRCDRSDKWRLSRSRSTPALSARAVSAVRCYHIFLLVFFLLPLDGSHTVQHARCRSSKHLCPALGIS